MKPEAAVLTGDLIGSTEASPERVEAALGVILRCFGPEFGFTRFRGDGWQIYLSNPGLGLHATVKIAAALRVGSDLQSRIALGLGQADNVNLTNLASASGSAFVASGRALDDMPKNVRFGLEGDGVDPLHQRLIAMIDERMQSWSIEQTQAAALAWSRYQHPSIIEIAETLGISRQAVSARLRSAGFKQVDLARWDFFNHFQNGPWPHA
jgi:hypothetical protein